ncbi:MAG: hypothetical protein AMXMBFR84_35990 [Candidatus Hydrogenedentota bacterium]
MVAYHRADSSHHVDPVPVSAAVRAVDDLIAQFAKGSTPILIRGERGTRKEDIARAIHVRSPQADGPFIKVSWAEVTESFVEGELFGYSEPTAAMALLSKRGKFQEAEKGTLYLEEVSDFSASTQGKLLRFIRNEGLQPLGAISPVDVDVRLILASSQDLEQLVERGKVLRELVEELSAFSIQIPPLRDRKTDILSLAQQFVRKHAQKVRKPTQHISSRAMSLLVSHTWPGNLVELEQCMERAVLLCDESVIDVRHLPPALQELNTQEIQGETLQDTLDIIERALILDALRAAKGNRSRAAQILGITERLMGLRVRKYCIDPREFRTK